MQTSGSSPANLVELLCHRARQHPDRPAFIFLRDGETEAGRLTYADLDRQARAIALQLQQRVAPGDRVLLVYPYEAGLAFIAAFWGCLYAQAIAIPCHAPRNPSGWADLQARRASAGATLGLTTPSLLPKLQAQLDAISSPDQPLPWLIPDPTGPGDAAWVSPRLTPDTLAFLQYTSGSTGQPKGVIITHDCLWQNQRMLQAAFGHTEASVGLGWLPLFHDMGLIGNVLQAIYVGSSCVLMSPLAFVQKPLRWLTAMSRYRATTSGGPNFAYDLLCRYVTDAQRDSLDLSTWEVAFCGAEPVRRATLDRFVETFQSCGFRREAFYPCYGMAEATLFITGGEKAKPPTCLTVAAAALEQRRVTLATAGRTQTLVSCGRPWLETQVVIADPTLGKPCGEDEIGEVWVSGGGIGRGYWQQPDLTEATFNAALHTGDSGFLRTGDLGFLHQGELFLTGRLHDVLVFWGFNHYPHQIEQTVEACHPGFRANGCAAFSAWVEGDERLVIVQEIDRHYRDRPLLQEVIEPIRWAIFQEHFVDVGAIVLVKPGGLPRTSSGKIQRRRCKHLFLEGSLAPLAEWRSTDVSDIPSLIRRYLNPLTHLRRWLAHWRQQMGRPHPSTHESHP